MKRGLFGKIFLLILIVFIVAIAGAAIYFYDYYVFKEMRVCITAEAQNIPINCSSNNDCINLLKENATELKEKLSIMPLFMRTKTDEIFNEAFYCNVTCKAKGIYGSGFNNTDNVQACREGEKEILIQIRGKEAIQLMDFLRQNKGF